MHQNFIEHFSILPDPRVNRAKRYPLLEIIFLIITEVLRAVEVGSKSEILVF